MCTHIGNSIISNTCIYLENWVINLIETTRYKFHSLDSCKTYKIVGLMLGEVGWGKQLKEPVAEFQVSFCSPIGLNMISPVGSKQKWFAKSTRLSVSPFVLGLNDIFPEFGADKRTFLIGHRKWLST